MKTAPARGFAVLAVMCGFACAGVARAEASPQAALTLSAERGGTTHYNCSDTCISGNVSGSSTSLTAGRSAASLISLEGIVVTAYMYESLTRLWVVAGVGTTDADGHYDIQLLSYGRYRVGFVDPLGEYLTEYYNNQPTLSAADDIYITQLSSSASISAELELDLSLRSSSTR